MATSTANAQREAPTPLPPARRTVGQLVAEAIRLYGRRIWPALSLGLSMAALNQIAVETTRLGQVVLTATVGALLLSVAFAVASALAADVRLTRRSFAAAVAVGVVSFAPAPFLALAFVLPAVAWLALFGLSVPAAVIEGRGLRASLARGLQLARADYVHALGSLATLAILYFLVRTSLLLLLRGQADATVRIAALLADVVVAPLLFLGAALLYFDQAARVGRSRRQRRR